MTNSKVAAIGAVSSFIEKALEPNKAQGGTVMIEYEDGWVVGAPLFHVHQAISILRDMNRQRKRAALRNAMKSIDRLLPLAKEHKASHQEAMFLAQDITIWFANEVVEGRKKVEDLQELKP